MRATPPWARMSDGTRSSAITAQAPASSAIFACSALVTSMMTPPLSMSARPLFTRIVPISVTQYLPTRCSSRGRRCSGPEGERSIEGITAVNADVLASDEVAVVGCEE